MLHPGDSGQSVETGAMTVLGLGLCCGTSCSAQEAPSTQSTVHQIQMPEAQGPMYHLYTAHSKFPCEALTVLCLYHLHHW